MVRDRKRARTLVSAIAEGPAQFAEEIVCREFTTAVPTEQILDVLGVEVMCFF